MNSKSYKFERGFSLVELLVTTAITGILVSLSAANVHEYRKSAVIAAGKIYLVSVHTAMVGMVVDDIQSKRVDTSDIAQYSIFYDITSETYTETRYNTRSTISLADFITKPPANVYFEGKLGAVGFTGDMNLDRFLTNYTLYLCDYSSYLSYYSSLFTLVENPRLRPGTRASYCGSES